MFQAFGMAFVDDERGVHVGGHGPDLVVTGFLYMLMKGPENTSRSYATQKRDCVPVSLREFLCVRV